MFSECLAGRPYPRNTCENQLSPSYPDSSHSSHAQGTCITSREAYSRATHENSFSLQLALSLHTLFLSHTTLTNKTHMKYRVHKIEHNYNQIWHDIKANKIHSCKLQLYNTHNKQRLTLLNINNIISNVMCYTMLCMLEWMRKWKHKI